MRFCSLHLLRYGHFTDVTLEFPQGERDFHIISGSNEAGKSTALSAIDDMLFGIPARSPHGFLHDYSAMRIGAHIENENDSLEVVRRKGSSNVLLGTDDLPIDGGDRAMNRFLAGIERSFFVRMFSLDHDRLRAGGQDLLNAEDDTGQVLFAAAAGVAGLRRRLEGLAKDAADQWAPRKSAKRHYYIAKAKFDDAKRDVREHLVTAGKWRERKVAREAAEAAHAEVIDKIRELGIERGKLNRIRRVHHVINAKNRLEKEIAELGNPARLPPDALKTLESAETARLRAEAESVTLEKQRAAIEELLSGFAVDDVIISRKDDIDHLRERRIEVSREQQDLPKRRAELGARISDLLADAREFGWTDDDPFAVIEKLPSRHQVATLRSSLDKMGGIFADYRNAEQLLNDAREGHDQLEKDLDRLPQPIDVSRLARATKAVLEQGDLAGQTRAAQKQLEKAQALAVRRMGELTPAVADEEILATVVLPARGEITDHRDRLRENRSRLREVMRHETEIRQQIEQHEVDLRQMDQGGAFVSRDALLSAREDRNRFWQMLDPRVGSDRSDASDDKTPKSFDLDELSASFESSMLSADELADQMFDQAETLARMGELERQIERLGVERRQSQENIAEAQGEGHRLDAEWEAMWQALPFAPLSPDKMMDWLSARSVALDALAARDEASRDLMACQDRVEHAREHLLKELGATGADIEKSQLEGLNGIVQRCQEYCDRQKEAAAEMARTKAAIKSSSDDLDRKEIGFRRADESRTAWQSQWKGILGELGWPADTKPAAANALLETLDRMRETAGQIRSLQHDRINKIEADIAEFQGSVDKLAAEIAPDLVDVSPDSVVVELERRLSHALRERQAHDDKIAEAKELDEQIDSVRSRLREIADGLAPLKAMAQVDSAVDLKSAIDLSDRVQSLDGDRREAIKQVEENADGAPFDQLEAECADVNIDHVIAREKAINEEIEELRTQQSEKATELATARGEFEAVGGDNRFVAVAAARVEEAATEIRASADQYIRLRTAERVLRWAIERHRSTKQAPLLERAGDLFRRATLRSFASLSVDFDQQDRMVLAGVRPNSERVLVSGMSTGTVDQLYLALRVAAIEDHLERAEKMPFVADDLFINFDDGRSAAGLEMLSELSKRTQVLFFTHHDHLVEIARDVLGRSFNLIALQDFSDRL